MGKNNIAGAGKVCVRSYRESVQENRMTCNLQGKFVGKLARAAGCDWLVCVAGVRMGWRGTTSLKSSHGPEQMLGGPWLGELWKLAKDWAVALPRKPEKWPEVAS